MGRWFKMPEKTRPLVVVDLNVIEDFGRCRDIAPHFGCVLCDVTGSELEGKRPDGKDYRIAHENFARWAKRNAHRIWIAEQLGALEVRQWTSPVALRRNDIIDGERTERFRAHAINKDCHWSVLRDEMHPQALIGYELARSQFMQMARAMNSDPEFMAFFRDVPPEEWTTKTVAVARDVGLSAKLLAQAPMGRTGEHWRRIAREAPGRLFAERFKRIIVYYAILGARKTPAGVPNDWDDAQYATLASYTGHLATYDRGLRGCMAAVFPDVRIVEPIEIVQA